MSDCGCEMEANNEQERKTLRLILGINAFMFAVEMALGLFAQSTGLIADSLDMLADAGVYAISLYAVGKSDILKITAAKFSGFAQVALALIVLTDVIRRFVLGSDPESTVMVTVGTVALIANVIGSIAICVGWLLPEGSVPGSLGRWNSSSHKLWV